MYAAFRTEYEGHDVRNLGIFLFYLIIFTFSAHLSHLHTYDCVLWNHSMGLKDKLRKFCVMKSVRDKAKESEDGKNN